MLQLLWVWWSATDDAMDVFVDYISMVDVGEGFIYRCRWAAAERYRYIIVIVPSIEA